jgi:ABC-type transport system substrate-binding protein
MSMMRPVWSAAVGFLMLGTLAAQGAPGAKPASKGGGDASAITGGNPAAKKGGTLTYEAYEPSSLNPISYKEAGAVEILEKWVFETLLADDVVTGELTPLLAKSYEISPDGKQFTFTLDERAKWFDGKPVTAEDVKFSFDVFSMEGANSPFRKAKMDDFSAVEIPSPGVIKFTAKERVFSNLEFLSSTLILPKHLYYSKDPKKLEKNEYTKAPKGSGPYMLDKWEKGSQSVLVRNPNYWGMALPQNKYAYNFDKIVIKYIRDPQIAFESLKKGDLDYMPVRIGNTSLWEQTKKAEPFVKGQIRAIAASSKVQQGYGFIGFNLQNELFADKRVRKALAMAVDRDELIQKTLAGLAVIPHGPLYSVANADGKFKPVQFDAKAASAELAALGWKDKDGDYILEKGDKKFSFTVIVPNARIEKELLFVQSYWKKIGVQANIKILEYSTWLQLKSERKFEALANGANRTFFEGGVNPHGEWHSENMKPGLGNFTGYSVPEVDALIDQGRQEMNFKKRKALFTKVNDIVAEDYPIFQYSESKYTLYCVNSKVVVPDYQGKPYYPYSFGEKYWYKK